MKIIKIFCLLLLTSCNGQVKKDMAAEKSVDGTPEEMWNSFVKAHPEHSDSEMPKSWYFGANKREADQMGKLVVIGKKTTASDIYHGYEEMDAELPKVGLMDIVTDFEGNALAIIQLRKVDTIPVKNITKEYAQKDMGTEVDALKAWKKYYMEEVFPESIIDTRIAITENTLVVCEWFEVIWPK